MHDLRRNSIFPRRAGLQVMGGLHPSAKPMYKIKEYQRHNEAGSVDKDAVAAEQAYLQKLLSTFSSKD
jgi:hypothetical protein